MNTSEIEKTTIAPTSGRSIHVYHGKNLSPVPGIIIMPLGMEGIHEKVLVRVFGEHTDSRERIHIFDPLTDQQRKLFGYASPDMVWAEWMPYQKGQAQKVEQVNEQIGEDVAELKARLPQVSQFADSLAGRIAAMQESLDAIAPGTMEELKKEVTGYLETTASQIGIFSGQVFKFQECLDSEIAAMRSELKQMHEAIDQFTQSTNARVDAIQRRLDTQ